MITESETIVARLWRDRAGLREAERDAALARARDLEERLAELMAENARLTAEVARLRMLIGSDVGTPLSETELQMEALRGALLPLIEQDLSRDAA
ncbi:hypothetical protein [Microvirga thermotolerans]|uniref:BZIP domain-containing protein n=1 Tax=Microvirga thermotolerans TaxID=2651334 RepID=A0A5P9K059_9HYPH|nr:hypothetical protein [Microvirga thermotolerans]QFU17919.1 hypothetical protein GDR74_17815 [Microvirga thermotolerans]